MASSQSSQWRPVGRWLVHFSQQAITAPSRPNKTFPVRENENCFFLFRHDRYVMIRFIFNNPPGDLTNGDYTELFGWIQQNMAVAMVEGQNISTHICLSIARQGAVLAQSRGPSSLSASAWHWLQGLPRRDQRYRRARATVALRNLDQPAIVARYDGTSYVLALPAGYDDGMNGMTIPPIVMLAG